GVRGGALGLGGSGSEEKLLVLDDSLSMGAAEGGRTSLERGAEQALAVLESLARAGSRDPVTVAFASRLRSPLLRGAVLAADTLDALRRALAPRGLRATDARVDPAALLEDLDPRPPEGRSRSLLLFTDLCAVDWTDGRGGPREAVARALARLGPQPD